MLPMMAQGAAQSVEDGATLSVFLKLMPDNIPGALARYEAVRKPRVTRIQQASAANRKRFHLPDGDAQSARDEALAKSGDRAIANIGWLYAYDAAKVL
jgi:salicylate hydroxylase